MHFGKFTGYILSFFILFMPLFGCVSKKPMQEISWDNMYGSWMSADGTVTSHHSLSIYGSVPVQYEGANSETAELAFVWPDELNHMNYGSETLSVFSNSKEYATEDCPYYIFGSTSYYEPSIKKPVPLTFVLFPDIGAAIFEDYGNDRYFVASIHSDTDLKALLHLCKKQILLEHNKL